MAEWDRMEVPFKDKLLLSSTYELMQHLIDEGFDKLKVITAFDHIINRQKVVARKLDIPCFRFHQIHQRKTKGKPEVHVQIVRSDYYALKFLLKKFHGHDLYLVTKHWGAEASLAGDFNHAEKEKGL